MKKKKKFNKNLILAASIIIILCMVLLQFVLKPNGNEIEIPKSDASQICQQISFEEKKYYCLGIVNRDSIFCNQLRGDDKNTCLALMNQDSRYCAENQRLEARKVCYYDLSRLSGNIEICNLTTNKEDCYFSFITGFYWDSKSYKIKTEYCERFSQSSPEGKTCLALKEMDSSLCEGNPSCLVFFNKNISYCKGLSSEIDRSECIRNVALLTKNVTVCDEIFVIGIRNDCYFDYAGHISNDIDICNKIFTQSTRQSCYVNVAVAISYGF